MRGGLGLTVAAIAAWFVTVASAQTTAPAPIPPPTLQKIRETGVITLAHREASIPFSYLDGNKRPVGYAVDLCLRIVEGLKRDLKMPNLKVEYVPVTGPQRLPTIVEGKADLECGNTTNTASRRKQVAFTVTHFFAGGRLLVKANSGIQRLSDLRNKVIVTNAGSTHAAFLAAAQEKGLISARIIETKDADAAFAAMEAGKADAFLFDDIVLYALRANSKDPDNWAIVGEFTTVEPLAIMLRKNDPDFKKYVDTLLSRAMVDGEALPIYRKWFLSPIPPKGITLGIPVSPLLREQFTFPTDKVGDEPGG